MRHIPLFLCIALAASAQSGPDRVMSALQDRALADQAARLKTDDRIAMYEALGAAKPDNLHYRNLLAATFIQKVRETTDYSYLDRAAAVLQDVLSFDARNYEALRLRSEIELERHGFAKVAEYSRALTQLAPNDPWNWGTLGDSLIELGDYDGAADSYQKMVTLRPDLSSYNRAAYYRFLIGDMAAAIEIMQRAVGAGSSSPENTAWCLVELGHLYFKSGKIAEAEQAYSAALRLFPGYHPAEAGLGRTSAAAGNVPAAIEHYKKAQSATPLPDYAAALHDLLTLAGRKTEAGKQMALIDAIDRLGQAAREKANRNIAMIYADHDHNVGRALELAQAELSVRKDIYTHDALAWALYKNGKYAEAEAAMREALKMNTPEPMFYYHAGMIAHAAGKNADAARFLRKSLALNPKFDLRQSGLAEKALKELAS